MSFAVFQSSSPLQGRSLERELGEISARGEYVAAESLLLSELGKRPDRIQDWLELASLRKNRGDFTGACAAYETFLKHSSDPAVKADLANALRLSGRLGEAEGFYRAALKEAPDNLDALWGLSQALYYRALWREGKSAGEALKESQHLLTILTTAQPSFALGFWRLAEVSSKIGETDVALEAYERALAVDGNFKKAHVRMARLLREKKEFSQALIRYEKARAVEPGNEAVRQEAGETAKQAPEAVEARRNLREDQWCRLALPALTPLAFSSVTIRVGLATQMKRLRFKSNSPIRVVTPAETLVARLDAKSDYWVRFIEAGDSKTGKEEWVFEDTEGKVLVTFDQRLRILPENPGETLALHALPSGTGYFFAKEQDRFYRGWIEFFPRSGKGFTVLNGVDLEAYIAGVLPSEMPSYWPLEALKVQAVVARSYGMSKMGSHNAEGYDVCDEVHCEAYNGVGGETQKTNQAVRETAGMVLKAGGKVLSAVFSAQCGGCTQDYGEAWGGYDLPVVGVKDFDSKANPGAEFPMTPARLERWIKHEPVAHCNTPGLKGYRNFRWAFTVSAGDLEAKAPMIGKLKRISVTRRSKAGWVTRLVLIGDHGEKEYKGDAVRSILGGLRSNLIYIETQMDPQGNPVELVVYGGGWGHGVGLCQVGAWSQAQAGRTWKSILEHYYPKADLREL